MAELLKQINVEVADDVGKLAEVTDLLSQAGVNITAMCAWSDGDTGNLMMVADDEAKACSAVKGEVDRCDTSDVVAVKITNKPGTLKALAQKLADANIFINFCYCTAIDASDAWLILDTNDNPKAAELL